MTRNKCALPRDVVFILFLYLIFGSFLCVGCGEQQEIEEEDPWLVAAGVDTDLPLLMMEIKTPKDLGKAMEEHDNLLDRRTLVGETLLMSFAEDHDAALVKAALEGGAKVDMADRTGRTALIRAVRLMGGSDTAADELECIRLLLDAGADPNHFSMWGTATGCARARVHAFKHLDEDTIRAAFEMLVEAGGDPDGIPDSVDRFTIEIGMPWEEAIGRMIDAGYREEAPPAEYLAGADWPEQNIEEGLIGRCFYIVRYGGWIFLEPELKAPSVASTKRVGRVVLWHVFNLEDQAAEKPVYPTSFELPAESMDRSEEGYDKAFEELFEKLDGVL